MSKFCKYLLLASLLLMGAVSMTQARPVLTGGAVHHPGERTVSTTLSAL